MYVSGIAIIFYLVYIYMYVRVCGCVGRCVCMYVAYIYVCVGHTRARMTVHTKNVHTFKKILMTPI